MKSNHWDGLCNKCQTKTCCINFLTPLITKKETKSIKKLSGFSDIVETHLIKGKTAYSLKTKPNTHECMFLGSDKNCTIYEYRPFECRIFPFDIYKINGKFTWVVYTCNPDLDWSWSEELLVSFEENLLNPDIVDHLKSIADLARLNEAGESYEYTTLREVNLNAYKLKNIK